MSNKIKETKLLIRKEYIFFSFSIILFAILCNMFYVYIYIYSNAYKDFFLSLKLTNIQVTCKKYSKTFLCYLILSHIIFMNKSDDDRKVHYIHYFYITTYIIGTQFGLLQYKTNFSFKRNLHTWVLCRYAIGYGGKNQRR